MFLEVFPRFDGWIQKVRKGDMLVVITMEVFVNVWRRRRFLFDTITAISVNISLNSFSLFFWLSFLISCSSLNFLSCSSRFKSCLFLSCWLMLLLNCFKLFLLWINLNLFPSILLVITRYGSSRRQLINKYHTFRRPKTARPSYSTR
jgi:hypothetical protein